MSRPLYVVSGQINAVKYFTALPYFSILQALNSQEYF